MKFSFLSLPRVLAGLVGFVFVSVAVHAQSTLPSARVGQAYSFQVTTSPPASAGTVYAATGLPVGLAINASSGLISGTPTTAGTYNGTVSLTSSSVTNAFAVVLTVNPPIGAPAITSGTTASGTVGQAFAGYTVTASNSPTSFNIGTLPPGLTASGASITGTPTTAGTFLVSLSANNAGGVGASTTLTITINAALGTPGITSATTFSTAVNNASFSYQITATNSPTSYSASGLPVGLSLNTSSGLITGTPSVAGVYSVALSAANASGTGPTASLTLTVGAFPVINSLATASGSVGTSFSYGITANAAASSYNVAGLPPGLVVNTTSGLISGVPSTVGTYNVTISANGAAGTGPNFTLAITIGAAPPPPPPLPPLPPPPSTPPTTTPTAPPAITAQPSSVQATAGANVSFTVAASGSSVNFLWTRNGSPISGATSSTLTLNNITAADAGTYSVRLTNSGGSIVSNDVTLTVISLNTPPVITAQPAAQSTSLGGNATFTVVAAGAGTLSYQWRKDGVAIAGATSATLSLSGVSYDAAGSYSVVVANANGSVTSEAVRLTLRTFAGSYFGTFGGTGGTFALFVRSDGTGVFLGFARTGRVALVSREVNVGADGRFSVTLPQAATPAASTNSTTPPIAAHEGEYHIDGSIAANGSVAGTVSSLNLTFSAPAATTATNTAALAGFYQAGAAGSSAVNYTIVGPGGDAFALAVAGASVDAGKGTINAAGTMDITTEANSRVTGAVQPGSGMISLTLTSATGATTSYTGANNDARADIEKLFNVSTRSLTGNAANVLIAGFVITGDQPKPVLIRAVGPSLAQFSVGNVLSAARLEVFRGTTSVVVGNDWGAGPNPAAVAATAVRVGAFALPNNSRDAAVLATLEPGAYTAVVTGQGGVSGVALIEAYDATVGAIPRAQRIINVSTRATAGSAENTLIAGFVITGTVPKRVLVRGVGPSLTQFGVTGALARPQVAVYSGTTVVAQNAGWSASPDAAAIAAAATQVGGFAFAATSPDAALILNLAPGAYTAQVSGVGGTSGVALVEVYEVP
ncbi:MAG TPA: putative Ig domain-containing protein [Opitutaceae bacterium]|nr:putative Ig domain-containing protein [Opitutaceae bacterium]